MSVHWRTPAVTGHFQLNVSETQQINLIWFIVSILSLIRVTDVKYTAVNYSENKLRKFKQQIIATALYSTHFTRSATRSVVILPHYIKELLTAHRLHLTRRDPTNVSSQGGRPISEIYLSLSALHPSNSLTDLWYTKHETPRQSEAWVLMSIVS
jgi:hypothetical protein